MLKTASLEKSSSMEVNTKEILMALGEILGKDTRIIEDIQTIQSDNNTESLYKRESEYLRNEVAKLKKEAEQSKRYYQL